MICSETTVRFYTIVALDSMNCRLDELDEANGLSLVIVDERLTFCLRSPFVADVVIRCLLSFYALQSLLQTSFDDERRVSGKKKTR